LSVYGILHPFRLVEEIKWSRGRLLPIHLEPHSRQFYHRWFLCDVPDCSVGSFRPDSLFGSNLLNVNPRIERKPATKAPINNYGKCVPPGAR
jgi:hypothetical protein